MLAAWKSLTSTPSFGVLTVCGGLPCLPLSNSILPVSHPVSLFEGVRTEAVRETKIALAFAGLSSRTRNIATPAPFIRAEVVGFSERTQ